MWKCFYFGLVFYCRIRFMNNSGWVLLLPLISDKRGAKHSCGYHSVGGYFWLPWRDCCNKSAPPRKSPFDDTEDFPFDAFFCALHSWAHHSESHELYCKAPTPPGGQDMSTEFLLRPAVSPLNINLELEVSDYGVYRWSRDIAVLAKYSCCCCDYWAGMLIIVGIPDARASSDWLLCFCFCAYILSADTRPFSLGPLSIIADIPQRVYLCRGKKTVRVCSQSIVLASSLSPYSSPLLERTIK